MTYETMQGKIKQFQDSSWYNYILMGSAVITLIIAGVNISNYATQIRSLKRQQGQIEG